MSNRISEKPIYQEYYTSSLQRWNEIFNEVDTIWKKTTWRTKIDKKRTEIKRQVDTKLDILLEETNMKKVNIDQIITKIIKIKDSKIEITFRYWDENQIQKPVVLKCLLLEYIETICSEDKKISLILYPNELLHLKLSIENQQLIIQIKNKKYKLFIYFQNLSQGEKVTDDIKTIIYIVKPSLIEFSKWRKYKNLNKKDWFHKYFLQSEGAFDNHVAWYIEKQTINQLKNNIDQLNRIWNYYWKEKLLYIQFLNKVIIFLLFDIWEFMCSLKYLIQNNFFLDKQNKTNYSDFKETLDYKMKVFKSDIDKKEPNYQKIKYFRNLVLHPGGFNYNLQKQQFDLPINYNYNYPVPPWFMLTWKGNKDNLHMYEWSHAHNLDPVLKNGINVENLKENENCLFSLSIKTINKVKVFLQDDLTKIN